jgi:hypothetical protein
MPSIGFEGTVRYAPPGAMIHWFWKLRLWWTDPLGKKWELTEPFVASESNILPSAIWSVDWRDHIVGGDSVVVSLRVVVNQDEIFALPIEHTFKVLGACDRIAAAYEGLTIYERAVMYIESRYRQFSDVRNGVRIPQYPLLNANLDRKTKRIESLDFGIKQVNSTHQKNDKFNIRHVWDWRENRELGRAILEAAKLNATGLPGRIRLDVKGAIQNEYKDAAYRSCPDFPADSLQYLWKEAYKRYNGGYTYDFWKWVPDNPKNESSAGCWQRIEYPEFKPNSDPQDPQPNPPHASSKYADEVWQIIVTHPKDWDVP